MKITVNGEQVTVQASTLADALDELGHGGAKVATAVNETFIPATMRAARVLEPGDRVEIVAPRQGG
ncbi:sulfur carrier protein ThiS [Actibacterium lipolyticum]|uniref:Sulfur carrier protein ThiS n=1 Tax=Actibacterium lipolyticum TaxID=1524263 RepID=A0A238L800_9RHOB|nr:sulfur carrier protein ThiS [Actibacterium lipolyticum]SMX51233.1 sulfur carrier protein ThiS [Actibacterium lipolyticum]